MLGDFTNQPSVLFQCFPSQTGINVPTKQHRFVPLMIRKPALERAAYYYCLLHVTSGGKKEIKHGDGT